MYWVCITEDKSLFDRNGYSPLLKCLKKRPLRKLKNRNLRFNKKQLFREKEKSAVNMDASPFNTGLFVDTEKASLLLGDVQSVLSTKYNIMAEVKPRNSSNTCELQLRPLQPCSEAKLLEAKELLQSYLTLIKQSKSRVERVEQDIEIVEIDDDEEDSCGIINDSSVVIVDVDECKTLQSNFKSNVERTDSCDEVVIVDVSPRQSTSDLQDCVPIATVSHNDGRGLKRKLNLEANESVEVVEIDDDIIVLDDSFDEPSCNAYKTSSTNTNNDPNISGIKVLVQGEERAVYHDKLKSTNELNNDNSETSKISATKNLDLTLQSNQTNTPNKSNNQSAPPRKKSKFAYNRPAHLTGALTKTAKGNESSSSTKDLSTNIYNPNAGLKEKRTGLRPIVIDGNNVAVGHGKGTFSLKGIQICINYFEKRGHRTIKAFVPHYRINRESFDTLRQMERQGTVVLTPSRKVAGQTVASYDDRYIVQYAAEFGGIIVSTDNYRDLIVENPTWKETIEKRLLMFTWVDDLLMFPQDPLGRTGPSLDDFLRFTE